jgi:4a-hydroxytetrahydrobiopterin dehydratase
MKSTLTAEQIDDFIRTNPTWSVREGRLERAWTFKDFLAAMAFVNRVAELAERAGHHPDIDIRYNRVLLGLVSHDAGGITDRDTAMATRLSSVFAPE